MKSPLRIFYIYSIFEVPTWTLKRFLSKYFWFKNKKVTLKSMDHSKIHVLSYFEDPNHSIMIQLQKPLENLLDIVWPCYRYEKVSSSYKLSNAPSLVIVRDAQCSQTTLVQKGFQFQQQNTSYEYLRYFHENYVTSNMS